MLIYLNIPENQDLNVCYKMFFWLVFLLASPTYITGVDIILIIVLVQENETKIMALHFKAFTCHDHNE